MPGMAKSLWVLGPTDDEEELELGGGLDEDGLGLDADFDDEAGEDEEFDEDDLDDEDDEDDDDFDDDDLIDLDDEWDESDEEERQHPTRPEE